MKRFSIIAATGLLIAGCASSPPGSGPRPQPQRAPQGTGQTQPLPPSQRPSSSQSPQQPSAQRSEPSNTDETQRQARSRQPAPPQTAAAVSSPAVMSLLGRADTLASSGHMDDAAATLERALDLEPRNPFIYQRLAAVRLAQGEAGQAEQLANKSNSVAGDNPFVEADNWELIAEARKATGDTRGAEAASTKAVNYERSTSQYSQ